MGGGGRCCGFDNGDVSNNNIVGCEVGGWLFDGGCGGSSNSAVAVLVVVTVMVVGCENDSGDNSVK